ncbi:hypothetical protein GCM10029978_003770 [Actinoallomurus acanthiterrae]
MIHCLLSMLAWLLVRPTPKRRLVADDTAIDIPAHVPDPSPEQLANLQGLCAQWLVMWCWYRREYAAIAKFGDEPTIIYDRDPQRLVFQCREVELATAA